MSRTVPEKRLDKNGRLVTKHVLAAPKQGSPSSAMPAPSVTGKRPVSKADFAREISQFLLEAAGEYEQGIAAYTYADNLGIRTLRLIHQRMQPLSERDSDLLEDSLNKLIGKTINQDDSQKQRDRIVTALVEALPVITTFCSPNVSAWKAIDVTYGVNYAAKHNRVLFEGSNVTDEDREVFRWMAFEHIIMNVATSRTKEWLRDESRWFTDNWDRLAAQADTIRERGTTDREFLSTLIADDTSAVLARGTL